MHPFVSVLLMNTALHAMPKPWRGAALQDGSSIGC